MEKNFVGSEALSRVCKQPDPLNEGDRIIHGPDGRMKIAKDGYCFYRLFYKTNGA